MKPLSKSFLPAEQKFIELNKEKIMTDLVVPFTLSDAEVKGRIVKLDQSLDLILTQHKYSESVARVLGELLLVTTLVGSQFKDEMILTIQLQLKDKSQYIVADYQYPGFIRGYAKIDKIYQHFSYSDFIENSLIIVTIDRGVENRYQGVVDIQGDSIAKAIEDYFYQSEQIKTSLKLKVGQLSSSKNVWCGCGVLIQKLPTKKDDDSWNDAKIYFETIKDKELLDPNLSIEKFLYSVYNEMEVKAYEPINIKHKCRCSRDRVEKILESLGFEEVVLMLIDGKISVDCQFCNKAEVFSCDDVNRFFNKSEKILKEDDE